MIPQILYITFDGLSDPLGQSQIIPYLSGLSNNFEITVLSCEKPQRMISDKTAIQNTLDQKKISWKYIYYNEEGGFISRLKNVYILLRKAKKLHTEKNFALSHARSYLSALVALGLKRKFNVPFIFDMRGFWADERFDGDIWKKNNLLHLLFYKYFKKKEIQFLSESSAIIFLTEAGREYLQKKVSGIDIKSKSTVIPCCVNVSIFSSEHITKKEIQGVNDDDHVLIYTGSIGTWYYTKEMIDCFKVWLNEIKNLKLLIITRDIKNAKEITEKYPDEVRSKIFITSASYSEIPSYLAIAKASIFFIKPAFSKIASSPTKMAECWAMNLPIITNSGIGDNDFYFRQKNGGILIDNFTEENYKNALKNYLNLISKEKCFREIAVNYFNTDDAVKSYENIYRQILKNQRK